MREKILLLCLLTSGAMLAQAPFAFNYQGVARDEFGSALFDQEISLFIEIVKGSEEGTIEYGEVHNVTTNDRGLFTLRIGEGDILIGNLRNIDWGIDRYFLRTEIDITGGDDYVPLGSAQLYSVPYALFAAKSGNSTGGSDDDNDPSNELQSLSISGQTLTISDGNSIELPISGGDGGSDDQTLSLDGSLLTIEDGNSVNLGGLGGGDSFWQSDGPFSIFYDGAVGVNLGEDRIITLEENLDNAGSVELMGPNASSNVLLTSTSANANHGGVALLDGADQFKLITVVNSARSGESWYVGDNGETNVFISNLSDDPNRGFIGVYDAQGDISSRMYAAASGQGVVSTSGSNGNLNALMTWLSGSTNNGYISVHDSRGDEEAGIYVDGSGRGVVFGDIKNFKMDHPLKEDHDIVYASIEGPEAGAYVRGTSMLDNGSAHIVFPEHFQHVISGPQSMTVMITPLSAESNGIAVVKKSRTGFVVKELLKGQGNYQFDWEVKAVRAGYEDYKVVRHRSDYKPALEVDNHPGKTASVDSKTSKIDKKRIK